MRYIKFVRYTFLTRLYSARDFRTSSHFNVIDGHGPAAKGPSRRAAFRGVSGLLRRDLHRMVVPSARTPFGARGSGKDRREGRLVSIDSRARKSVIRSRRGADAENIHHVRGALSRPVDLRFIITFSPAPRRDRWISSRPYLEMRSPPLISRSRRCVQLNGKMRRTCACTFLCTRRRIREQEALLYILRYAEMDRACLINC